MYIIWIQEKNLDHITLLLKALWIPHAFRVNSEYLLLPSPAWCSPWVTAPASPALPTAHHIPTLLASFHPLTKLSSLPALEMPSSPSWAFLSPAMAGSFLLFSIQLNCHLLRDICPGWSRTTIPRHLCLPLPWVSDLFPFCTYCYLKTKSYLLIFYSLSFPHRIEIP